MNLLFDKLDVPFTFHTRPSPIPGDLRPIWRMSLILLVLLYSRAQKASLQKLHVMSWATRTERNRNLLRRYMNEEIGNDEIVPRIEPSLNRAIDFAKAEGLVAVDNGKNLELTEEGLATAKQIDGASECMSAEKMFLKEAKAFATERTIDGLLTWNLNL